MNVKKVGENMYRDNLFGALIKTSLCLSLSLGEEVILIWDCALNSELFGCGKLLFLQYNQTCRVDAVYK